MWLLEGAGTRHAGSRDPVPTCMHVPVCEGKQLAQGPLNLIYSEKHSNGDGLEQE